jgi:hypothetical protein
MSSRLIAIALLLSFVLALDIRNGSNVKVSLFEDYFPSDSEKYLYEKSILGNSNDLLEIYRTILSWKINVQISQDFTTKHSFTLDKGGFVYKNYYFRSPVSQIMRLNFNSRTI